MSHEAEKDRHNKNAIEAAFYQARSEIEEAIKTAPFFTASLTVTVQHGQVSLSKVGVEKTQLFSPRR